MSIEFEESLVEQQKWEELRSLLASKRAPEVAEILMNMSQAHRVSAFHLLFPLHSSEVFPYFHPEAQESLLREMADEEVRELLAKLRPDDRTGVLEGLPQPLISRLLNLLNPQDLQNVRQLLEYPEESVGRLMTPDFLTVQPQWTIAQTFQHIRKEGKHSETVSIIYVIDADRKLLDAVELERLVLESPSDSIANIMETSFVALYPENDQEEAVRTMQKYDLVALPVVNSSGTLLGIVTADDLFDVAEEEATEDIQKGAAVEPLKTGYRDSSPWAPGTGSAGSVAMTLKRGIVTPVHGHCIVGGSHG